MTIPRYSLPVLLFASSLVLAGCGGGGGSGPGDPKTGGLEGAAATRLQGEYAFLVMVRDTTAAQVRSEMGLATADGRGSLTVSSTYLVSGRRLVRSPHAGPGGLPGGRGPVTEDHRAGVRVVRGARGRRRFPGAPVRARLPQPGYGHPDASCGLPSRQRSRGRLDLPRMAPRGAAEPCAQLDHQRDHHGSGHGAARRDIAHLQRGRPDQPPAPRLRPRAAG